MGWWLSDKIMVLYNIRRYEHPAGGVEIVERVERVERVGLTGLFEANL